MNRWKMSRIGFVNFWLYDEEDFEFVDGKLLLRGQNGSGKSITTQSFIPFILDGDRTPSRLDPFGSSDRRMEYYFLGEDGKDESTGYLFLEFKKENTGEYRTIGIGQRAKRGKSMDFWGFVILDGHRIGRNVQLYKEVGSVKIPYDKRELKALLGENNIFTDSQSEYKKYVNQYIFGFRKPEQYEQFIRLLVKVRAPKLSKEFKPSKVYDILNDSLQTLTDEDLRVMVDAMEKMDEIQDSLDMLRRAFADVKAIRNEYIRYNQYMIAKKAKAYLEKRKAAEAAQRQLDSLMKEIEQTKDEEKSHKTCLDETDEKIKLAEVERAGLLDSDLESVDQKLKQAQINRQDFEDRKLKWDRKIDECKERISEAEWKLREIQNRMEMAEQRLLEEKQELELQQETLQWSHHHTAAGLIEEVNSDDAGEIARELNEFRKQIEICRKAIESYEVILQKYDELESRLEQLRHQKHLCEQELEMAQANVTDSIDQWIIGFFDVKKAAVQWRPDSKVVEIVEEKIRQYKSAEDAGAVRSILWSDYERQYQELTDERSDCEHELKLQQEALDSANQELLEVQNQDELEPERDESAIQTREALEEAGIKAVPFYKCVEFADEIDAAAGARLEAQLQKIGVLDALVVSTSDMEKIKTMWPQFLDTILWVEEEGASGFSQLVASGELSSGHREMVERILSNIYEGEDHETGIYLGADGSFSHGILVGRAYKSGSAEFVGHLARKKRREDRIRQLQNQIQEYTEKVSAADKALDSIKRRMDMLSAEYKSLPEFAFIDVAIEREKTCSVELQRISAQCSREESQELELSAQKNEKYQAMLRLCKNFPYARTAEAYGEIGDVIEEYKRIWQDVREDLVRIRTERSNCEQNKEQKALIEQAMDEAYVEKRGCETRVKEFDIQIRQYEDYLNRPENVQKAKRLKEIRVELEQLNKKYEEVKDKLIRLDERIRSLNESEPKQKLELQQLIESESILRTCFEEELALKLVVQRDSRTLTECAKEAEGVIRENDKNREASDMLNALYQVYQRHNGSLANYGTSLEECFESANGLSAGNDTQNILRKRVRVVSVWNGKKVYMEEFYGILKAAIEETELLIQKKDRELFEDILSQTISRQLTDRIEESRKWVSDMSKLMKEMDTSMGLSFSLEWKPGKAESDTELDTVELEQILLRDHSLLTMEDIEKVASHFRSKIHAEKQKLEESGSLINYMELVRDALDYRKWFQFQMYFRHGSEQKKPLTNAAFNRFSGGEKAMAMYVPLFAAVNAQYQKSSSDNHPRLIALDEAFAGVDDKNISSMFELVHKLDFDYIMNSQALWGCYETVRNLRIAELQRPQNSQTVSVIRYTWNGHERTLDEQ